jgi:hypothetical protein
VPLDDMIELVELNNGHIIKKAAEFKLDKHINRIVIIDEQVKKELITQDLANYMVETHIKCFKMSWILDSIACYQIIENTSSYALISTD